MAKDNFQAAAKEQSVLVAGLIDALIELYPDVNHGADDAAFLAVLSQAQHAAYELRKHIESVEGDDSITQEVFIFPAEVPK
ncbi:hypothetical protein SAMN05443432_11274 [Roseovarius litoreus]|uniref:Uncharacterized protein n=1 Tax=Roseovarius litoreus TaxID=1155722 RepID=A0A1M7KYJ4_9RHOB|nr:hypothetical protein [Roseovarius litoreus]SHM70682.1 hypothetical protein SAMN05443432_11274 [Roseovarius litoreus]